MQIMMMQAELLSFSCGMQSRIATITLLEQCWVSLDRRSPLVIPLCVALSHQHLSAVAEHMQNSGSVAEQVIKLLNRARDVTSSALELQQELAEAMASRENNPNSTFDKHANLDRFQLLYRAAHCCLLSRDDEVALKYLRDALACSRALQAAQRKTASTMAAVASASFVTQGQSTWWGICLQPMQCHTGLSLSCDISPHAFDKLFAIQLIRSKRTKECIEFLQKRVADQTAECGERCLPTADLWQCLGTLYLIGSFFTSQKVDFFRFFCLLGDTYAYQGNLAEAGEAFSKALSCALSIAASASTFNQADVAVHQSLHDIVVKATMTSYVQSLAPAIIETLRAKLRAVRFVRSNFQESPPFFRIHIKSCSIESSERRV
jgi:tetratricopeptide (TPR) repeat protein